MAEGGSGSEGGMNHTYMIVMIAVCCLAGVIALVLATVCYYNLQNKKKQTKEVRKIFELCFNFVYHVYHASSSIGGHAVVVIEYQ